MNVRRYLFLSFVGLGVALLVSTKQSSPGYMDADYYFLGGVRLASGHGFTEPVLWNYLDDPAGLPHPSHAYWMPLASTVAALGLELSGQALDLPIEGFPAARLIFLVLLGLLPPLTASLSYSLTSRQDLATWAGLLAVFPGFYLPFLTTTDTFLIYMLLGTLFLQVAWQGSQKYPSMRNGRARFSASAPILLGALSGLMHLARADGALWVAIGGLALWLWMRTAGRSELRRNLGGFAFQSVLLIAGYFLVMGPWLIRNLVIFGTPLAPGGIRTLWLTDYNEIFAYPAGALTLDRWLDTGVGTIFKLRLKSIGLSLGGAIAVQGQVFLVPLILVGLQRLWHDIRVRLAAVAWLLTFLVMTLAFPESGWRGGFFHSGAALQPLLWAVAPVGLQAFINWGARRRGWQPNQARLVFGWGIVTFAVLLSAFSVQQRVVGGDFRDPFWDESARTYRSVETQLQRLGASQGARVLVNNPPGYYIVTGRPAIVIPNGGVETLLEVADRYGAWYVILEPNHPQSLNELYSQSENHPGLEQLWKEGDTILMKIKHP